jgi:hypothetical protein
MAKTKPQPKRGNRVVAITSYTRLKSGTEILHETIYYVDTKRRMVWEEYGLDVGPLMRPRQPYGEHYQAWARQLRQRSLKALVAKYHSDFDKVKLMFSGYDIEVQELGVL